MKKESYTSPEIQVISLEPDKSLMTEDSGTGVNLSGVTGTEAVEL